MLEFGGEHALPIAGDVLADFLRLIDEATPAREGGGGLGESSYEAGGRAGSVSSSRRASDALLPWLRAMHVMALACAQQLEAEPSAAGAEAAGAEAEAGAGAADASGASEEELADGESMPEDGDHLPMPRFFGELITELCGADDEGAASDPQGVAEAEDEDEEVAAMKAQQAQQAEEEAELAARTPPAAGQLALSALGKAEVLLLSGSAVATHQLLDMISVTLRALAPWPRAILPAVYPMWPPLLQLAGGDDRSVAAHAMRVLSAAASHYGDGLSSRVAVDAIGKLTAALRKHGSPPRHHHRAPPAAGAAGHVRPFASRQA